MAIDPISAGLGILGLFKGPSAAEKAQTALLKEQQKLATEQRGLYTNVGVPGYMTGLQGLLSSFGYRPPEQGVAGTSLGQPPTGGARPTTPSPYARFQPGGQFGYYAGYGQQLGAQTDEYETAKQHILNLGLPPALEAASLQRLEMERASNQQNLAIQAQQAGPMALLQALNPALGSATGASQSASAGAAQAGQIVSNEQQAGNSLMQAISQIAQALYKTKPPTNNPIGSTVIQPKTSNQYTPPAGNGYEYYSKDGQQVPSTGWGGF